MNTLMAMWAFSQIPDDEVFPCIELAVTVLLLMLPFIVLSILFLIDRYR